VVTMNRSTIRMASLGTVGCAYVSGNFELVRDKEWPDANSAECKLSYVR
jgi:hypothetical protein